MQKHTLLHLQQQHLENEWASRFQRLRLKYDGLAARKAMDEDGFAEMIEFYTRKRRVG